MFLPETTEQRLRVAFSEIIEGKTVKRVRHELRYDGNDLTSLFVEELERLGYQPTTVEKLSVEPGERVPAFYLEGQTAHFGWIFWEQFTSWKLRKLWGSVVKNKRGDWALQIPTGRPIRVYANESLKLEMDIDHPPEF